jgi:hypothetical protein
MPKKLDVDWKLAESLYLQGVKPPVIAERVGIGIGTIYAKASRKGWAKTLAKTRDSMTGQAERVAEVLSETVKAKFARRLLHLSNSLPDYPLPLKEELAIQSKLEPAIRNARTILGWKEGNTQPSVRINVMAGATVISTEPEKTVEVKESILLPEEKTVEVEGGTPLREG